MLVVFLLASASAKADLVVSNDTTPRYEHTLYDTRDNIIIAIAITPDKYYDFSDFNHDIAKYLHTVTDNLTGDIWNFEDSLPKNSTNSTLNKLSEPETLAIMLAGVLLITVIKSGQSRKT